MIGYLSFSGLVRSDTPGLDQSFSLLISEELDKTVPLFDVVLQAFLQMLYTHNIILHHHSLLCKPLTEVIV